MILPKRKSTRLKEYDYSAPGVYFVTICTYNRKNLLSTIVGDVHERPEAKLTRYGIIVDEIIKKIPDRFRVRIDKYVIMPNHIHLLISIPGIEIRDARERPLQEKQHSIVANIVGYIKMNASKRIHYINKDVKVWQRLSHDHIIRGEKDYLKIWDYIDTNVIRWKYDCFYTVITTGRAGGLHCPLRAICWPSL